MKTVNSIRRYLEKVNGIDIETEIARTLSIQIQEEIDKEILADLMKLIGRQCGK